MDLMRKLRDEGKFKNSMLAEIERDEMMEKMKEQIPAAHSYPKKRKIHF